jgi:RNA-directed DNA polymerase
MRSVQRFLKRTLKLRVNQEKSRVAPTDQATFLGFTFRGGSIRWTDKAFREFKRRAKEFTGRSWFVSMDYRFQKLAQYLRGWVNYFGIADYYRPISGIDHWIRRRVRMCYWKQWRRPRTKVRELLRLGTSLSASIPVAMSRKGPPGSHPRYPDRHDQQVAQGSGASVCQRAVGQHPLPGYGPVDSVDRPVRTRMRGGGAP